MKYKIGVYGSAINEMESTAKIAKELGQVLGDYDIIIVTGACSGIPYLVASEATKKGKEVWGFSPELNFNKQKKAFPNDDISIYSKLFYMPQECPFAKQKAAAKKYRNVTSTATVDAGIIIAGWWRTMNEYTNLYDMEKVIGVLTGIGGIADEIKYLNQKIHKPSKANIIYNESPRELVEDILKNLSLIIPSNAGDNIKCIAPLW